MKSSFMILLYGIILTGCSTGYKNDGEIITYQYWNEGSGQHSKILEANPKTFRILSYDSYAKDDKNVFYDGEMIIGADANSFEALDDYYARDKNFGWHGKDTVISSNGKTFSVINNYFSTDGIDVFFETSPLHITNPKKFKFIYGEGEYQCWTTDGNFYYFNQYKIPSNDYKNIVIYPKSGGIAKDSKWVYYLDHKLNYNIEGKLVVDTIDALSFNVTGYLECNDKYGCFNVYHGRKKCE